MKIFYVLSKMRLLSPRSLFRLIAAFFKDGINLMTLLRFAGKTYSDNIAVIDDYETLTYKQLLEQSEKLAIILSSKYKLKSGQKVGLLCRNHGSLIKSIFAVSRLGADVYLLNSEMSKGQFEQLHDEHRFDFLIYDAEVSQIMELANFNGNKLLSYHDQLPAINNLCHSPAPKKYKLKKTTKSKLMLLTGGTTGKSKKVVHKPSIFNYLNPFITMLTRLKLFDYQTAYIATPIYHGYGVAVLLLFTSLGKKVVIQKGFDAEKACELVQKHNVEVITVVPLMIQRMLRHNPKALSSLACIASGGAELNPKLVNEVSEQLGRVLYNLYGTSEAGLNMIATPEDLAYSPNTIGKRIKGVHLKVLDSNKKEVESGTVGQFCVKNKWSMTNRKTSWIETGDLGYLDENEYYFICGRTDDMIVSGGENVYPIEVEQVMIQHPLIEAVAVVGVSDEEFGQRLKAFVQPINGASLSKGNLEEWLRPRVARFKMPKEIILINRMPYTLLGKLDKKQLEK